MVSLVTILITLTRTLFLLLLGVSVSLVVLAPITLASQRPSDPFVAYADLLLSEPPYDFVRHGFDCQVEVAPSFAWNCILKPSDGKFSEVRVRITYNDGHTRQLTFIPRPNTFVIGDLVLLWGKPEVRLDRDYTYFNWPDAHAKAIITTLRQRYSHFQSVSYMAIIFPLSYGVTKSTSNNLVGED